MKLDCKNVALRRILFLILVVTFYNCDASNDSIKTEKRFSKIYFYTAGLQRYNESKGSCRDKQAAKMGFGYKIKGGCVVRPLKFARIQGHNRRVEKKLEKRFGSDWHEQYEKSLLDCKS